MSYHEFVIGSSSNLCTEHINYDTQLPTYPITRSTEQTRELVGLQVVTGEDRARVLDAEMPRDDFTENVPKIGGDRKIAAVVALFDRKARPLSVHTPAAHATANHHHRVAMPVIGPTVAVLVHRSPKLRHRQHDGVFHAIAEIGNERRDPL